MDEILPDWDSYYMGIAFAVREKANCTGNRVAFHWGRTKLTSYD